LCTLLVVCLAAPAAMAQEAQKLAVIDVNRIMTDSARGKAVLDELEQFQKERSEGLKTLNDEIVDLQSRYQEGRLSLAEDKLVELEAQIEDRTRALQRAQEDAQRELQKRRGEDIKQIEQQVFPIINAVGREFGYTMIFNKFQSGLVYADDNVDITELVIQRLDAAGG
jgi:outer membrane protein